MKRMSRQRLRKLERQGQQEALHKVLRIQEQQIAELVAERDALASVVTGAANLEFDYVDPETGEIFKRRLIGGRNNGKR